MPFADQKATAAANYQLHEIMQPGGGIRPAFEGSEDMFIKQIDSDGNIYSALVPGGLSKYAQGQYQLIRESHITKIMNDAGVNRTEAERLLNTADRRSSAPSVQIKNDKGEVTKTIKLNGMLVDEKISSDGKRIEYLPWGALVPPRGQEDLYQPLTLDYQIQEAVRRSYDPNTNPAERFRILSELSKKTQESTLTGTTVTNSDIFKE